jgi:hypothetical protein
VTLFAIVLDRVLHAGGVACLASCVAPDCELGTIFLRLLRTNCADKLSVCDIFELSLWYLMLKDELDCVCALDATAQALR